MAVSAVRTKHWTRVEYERLIDLGAFQPGERLELVGGALLVCEPQGGPHFTAVGLIEDALRHVFGTGWTVRAQGPIALDDDSEPEPDIAVVPGTRRWHSIGARRAVSMREPGSPTTGSSIYLTRCWRCTESRYPPRTRSTAIATRRPSRWGLEIR